MGFGGILLLKIAPLLFTSFPKVVIFFFTA